MDVVTSCYRPLVIPMAVIMYRCHLITSTLPRPLERRVLLVIILPIYRTLSRIRFWTSTGTSSFKSEPSKVSAPFGKYPANCDFPCSSAYVTFNPSVKKRFMYPKNAHVSISSQFFTTNKTPTMPVFPLSSKSRVNGVMPISRNSCMRPVFPAAFSRKVVNKSSYSLAASSSFSSTDGSI